MIALWTGLRASPDCPSHGVQAARDERSPAGLVACAEAAAGVAVATASAAVRRIVVMRMGDLSIR